MVFIGGSWHYAVATQRRTHCFGVGWITLGGYPRIAYLPKGQQWRAAQLKPGDRLRFRMS